MTKPKKKSIETLEDEVARQEQILLREMEIQRKVKKRLYELEAKKEIDDRKIRSRRLYIKGGIVEEVTGEFIDHDLLRGLLLSLRNMSDNDIATLKNAGNVFIEEKEKNKR